MFNYKIPQEIKIKLTKEFMTNFLIKLIQVFNLHVPISFLDDIVYLEHTCGWSDAFQHTCQKHKIKDVFTYYNNLEWYDSDCFDNELGKLLVDYELIKEYTDLSYTI